jgi:hypothetical protein
MSDEQRSDFKAFLSAFTSRWLISMSGGASVPLALATFFVPETWQKVLTGLVALACLAASSYFVWRKERLLVKSLQERLRPKLEFVFEEASSCKDCIGLFQVVEL